MPKRIKHSDPNQTAISIVRKATGEESYPGLVEPSPETISAVMAALGRRGGPKGGAARAKMLSPAKRKAIAQKAAAARWKK
jgi:hypothetical protein